MRGGWDELAGNFSRLSVGASHFTEPSVIVRKNPAKINFTRQIEMESVIEDGMN